MRLSIKILILSLIILSPYFCDQVHAETIPKPSLCTDRAFVKTVHQLWLQVKPEYFNWAKGQGYTADGFPRYHPYELYDIQIKTNNLLKYSMYCHDTYILQELVCLYGKLFKSMEKTNEYVFYYYPGSPRESVHKLDQNYRMWRNTSKKESILCSSQFLYIVSEALIAIANLEPAARGPLMLDFASKAETILQDHYQRWIFVHPGPFQVRGWGCKTGGRYVESGLNHFQFLKRKLAMSLGDAGSRPCCNAVADTDMWIITGVSNLLTANKKDPGLVQLSAGEKKEYRDYLQTGLDLLQSRITFTELKNFSGKKVKGAVFDAGYWDDSPSYKYSTYTGTKYPEKSSCKPQPPEDTAWDISHARRFVDVFGSLHRNRLFLQMNFPDQTVLNCLSNQFVYKIFNGDYERPLFSNFWNGINGWYRVSYNKRDGFGYGPWDLSIAALTGGYGFWARYNQDIGNLYCRLCMMITCPDDLDVKTFIQSHYSGNRWINFHPSRLTIFEEKITLEKLSFLLSFIPSLCFVENCNSCDFACLYSTGIK